MCSMPTERSAGEPLDRLVEVSWNCRKADYWTSLLRVSANVCSDSTSPPMATRAAMSGVRDAINAPSRSTDRLKDATLLYLGGASLRSRISNTNVVLAWLIHLRSSSERGAK